LVALTVTPALAYLLFGKGVADAQETRLQQWLKGNYQRLLRFVARWPRSIMVGVAAFCVGAAALLPFFGGEFLPQFREGHVVLQVLTTAGTSLTEMLRLGGQISGALLKNPQVDTVEQQIGRAELGEDPWGPNRCEFHVELKSSSGEEQEKTQNELDDIL